MPKHTKPARTAEPKRPPAPRATKNAARRATPAASPIPATPFKGPSKKATVLGLLQRPQGAAISELTEVTGWQVHSVRAALTGLRKEGQDLSRVKDAAGVTRYRIASEA